MNNFGHSAMSSSNLVSPTGLGGLASRRGGQGIKPLSMDALKSPTNPQDNGPVTPRTSRSHLLAGLRTAPKTAVASSFGGQALDQANEGTYGIRQNTAYSSHDNLYNGPKTSMPRYGNSHQQMYSNGGFGTQTQQYQTEQALTPPEIQVNHQPQDGQMDTDFYAALVQQNLYLAQQRQALQQQLTNLAQAQQQLGVMSLGNQQAGYANLYQQQLQQAALQSMMQVPGQPNVYTYIDPVTGQSCMYVDQNQGQGQFDAAQMVNAYQQQQVNSPIARQQTSPFGDHGRRDSRNISPPRRNEYSNENVAPLPPPSANAFRRGHNKSSSLVLNTNAAFQGAQGQDGPKTAGPKTAGFPMTPMTAGFAPGRGRAGEHPIREPRPPPSIEELKAKPTAKHEGSKNFATRTRRSALSSLMRAGLERRKGSGSGSPRSFSPISESAEEAAQSAITDAESDSGRSGSGSLNGEEELEGSLPSSRTSTGSWGAIGAGRPISRQASRESKPDTVEVIHADTSASDNSFASIFKNSGKVVVGANGSSADGLARKAPMLVLTSSEKRRAYAV